MSIPLKIFKFEGVELPNTYEKKKTSVFGGSSLTIFAFD
jgi:hypothetical protein